MTCPTPIRMPLFSCLLGRAILMMFPLAATMGFEVRAQETVMTGFPSRAQLVEAPYSGKYEARIGGSRESQRQKLRLDIGGSVDLFHWVPSPDSVQIAFGADFFTWTRLRFTESFKFPVEAVDYYFGVGAAARFPGQLAPGLSTVARLRAAHISAHLVDGDPGFANPVQQYHTYSREFVDLMLGMEPSLDHANARLTMYVGAQVLFHTIPDTLGALSPYTGFDLSWQPWRFIPISMRAGYEARLNTELTPVGEHLARVGAKIGEPGSNGVIVEGGYYSGRSQYGQHFSERERYFSLGFAIEF